MSKVTALLDFGAFSFTTVSLAPVARVRYHLNVYFFPFFRWFKFTLKPPYSITFGKLRLAIWDTFFWTFLVKFGHKGP